MVLDKLREQASKQKTGKTLSRSTKCLHVLTQLALKIRDLTEFDTRHVKQDVTYDEEYEDGAEDDRAHSIKLPLARPAWRFSAAAFHGASRVQDMDRRNDNERNE
ncbi:Hypothetical predicted protein [Paramuricea clavata]|uniref:Uncharacterized protein n=1 Tax=Paramuricea clavata TaxID=317549 RepID=A0A7D9JZF5_PARCT|nr:Hypothetical predicted protein [Paramuricea clavata]